MKTEEEMLAVANEYIVRCYPAIYGRKQMFAAWFVKMLKQIGCPQEVYACEVVIERDRTYDPTEEKKLKPIIDRWKKFYKQKMNALKEEAK